MRSALLAVAVALVLVVSVLVLVPGLGRGVPEHSGPAHPLATVTVTPTNSGGGTMTAFQTGAAGNVYFTAFDPSDPSVVVAVNDQNATRDHLTNPVHQWTVPIQGNFNFSYLWNTFYTIPYSLGSGGAWNLTIAGTVGGFASTPFQVSTYQVQLTTNATAYLAGHAGTLLFNVVSTVNGAPYSNLTSLTLKTQYTGAGFVLKALPGVPSTLQPVVSAGTVSFPVPTDAQTGTAIFFYLWANNTGTNVKDSELGVGATEVGAMQAAVTLASCEGCAPSTTFTAGTPVYVLVQTTISFAGIPASSLTAKLQFTVSATTVTNVPGNPPLTLTTDRSGQARILFLADPTVFSTRPVNQLTVTVSDPLNTGATAITNTVTFSIVNATLASTVVTVSLDSQQYFGGDTATATWQIGGQNATVANGWTPSTWSAWEVSIFLVPTVLIANGSLASGTHGTFQFQVPATYTGTIEVTATAYNRTTSQTAFANAVVSRPALLLTPSEMSYLPGDSVTVTVTTEGSIFSGTTLYETVVTGTGYTMSSGVVNGNSIQFSIPSVATPASVTVTVGAQSPTMGLVSSNSITLSEAAGVSLQLGINTASNYADGSYQPGQTVTLSYAISTFGTAVLGKTFVLRVGPIASSGVGVVVMQSTQLSGQFSYSIPSGLPTGSLLLIGNVQFTTCGPCGASAILSLVINPNPSVINYQLGAGSGLTVGWIILLILVILTSLALYLAIRNMRRSKPSGPRPFVPPPGTEPSPAWQESSSMAKTGETGSSGPSSGGEDQPPLPPGATK